VRDALRALQDGPVTDVSPAEIEPLLEALGAREHQHWHDAEELTMAHDRIVRECLVPVLDAVENITDDHRRFLALWLDIGDERRDHDSWQAATVEASRAAFNARASQYGSLVRNFKRGGSIAAALEPLVDALVSVETPEPGYRDWLYGPRRTGRGDDRASDRHAGRFVVVTAHHGTGLRQCVDKYVEYRRTLDESPLTLVWFDDFLIGAAPPFLRDVLADHDEPVHGRQLSRIYSLPRRTLQVLWRLALDAAWPAVVDGLRQGNTVLFACNASIFHEQSGAISAAFNDAALVERVLETKRTAPETIASLRQGLVITIIDDIFDCAVRLTDQGDVLDPSLVSPDHATRATVLRTILDWRQHEVLNAERITRLMGWRHVIFPAKHPLATFHKVVSGRPIVYFSHPLHQVRVDEADGRPGERRLVNELFDRLGEQDDVAVLDPAAIDEHRLEGEKDPSSSRFTVRSLRLLPRWRSAEDLAAHSAGLLWAPIAPPDLAFVEQPFAPLPEPQPGTNDPRRLWLDDSTDTLLVLRAEIERQRKWRLRLMVNQAEDSLFVYRPFGTQRGRIREGAVEEIMLRRQLVRHQQSVIAASAGGNGSRSPRHLLVFHPRQDERRRALDSLELHLLSLLIPRVQVSSPPEELGAVLAPIVEDCLRGEYPEATDPALADRFLVALEPLPTAHHAVGRMTMDGEPAAPAEAERQRRRLAGDLRRCIEGRTGENDLHSMTIFDDAHWVARADEPPEAGPLAASFLHDRATLHEAWSPDDEALTTR
jgi:hypothetical protein